MHDDNDQIIVTLINGKTGEIFEDTGPQIIAVYIDPKGSKPARANWKARVSRVILTETLGRTVAKKIKYEDSCVYAPRDPNGQEWIYFRLTGWEHCSPCVGWIARGYDFRPNGNKGRSTKQTYVGISPDPRFERHVIGRPSEQEASTKGWTEAKMLGMQGEWEARLVQFKSYFMVNNPNLATVFVDGHGAHMLTGSTELHIPASFTQLINDALKLQFSITFDGYYDAAFTEVDPHRSSDLEYRYWRYFELIGGDPGCTIVSPCFGFYTTECLAIVKPTTRPSPLRFETLGTHGIQCAEMTAKFEKHFMKDYVWLPAKV
ncbi:hypothetical protein BDP27DRAFT_1359631 [Rhodocollybia butyracea]|uniref:Uncharacterized protein n=1 Tax=Rhodocollybia butyracea TaxID=206335 RepID=A0A9P5UBG7_9AGAR|nr:hypothetical protein BDP27DRAFT_1359631 [Rhodocollybia butyracea]